MKEIYLILDNNGFFAHHIEFGQLDKNIVIQYFKKFNIDIRIATLNALNITNAIIFTLSSQKPYHKFYIDDINQFFELNNNILIPSLHIIKSHDNKGYQELYKKCIGLVSLKSFYINKDTINYTEIAKIGYPLVLKKLDGSGSMGVELINSESVLKNRINKLEISFRVRFFIYLKEKLMNLFLKKKNLEKVEYFKDYNNYVVQEFIPNLKFDYKVLIFFDKYYVLKRHIKSNDFRASGSGNFEFIDIEDSLLEFSQDIFQKFNEPFLSFDICFDGYKYYLIEYQGIHFGPYTQINSKGFYQKKYNKWHFIEEKVSLELDIAYALYNHCKINYL